jgi:hypothetical protein
MYLFLQFKKYINTRKCSFVQSEQNRIIFGQYNIYESILFNFVILYLKMTILIYLDFVVSLFTGRC